MPCATITRVITPCPSIPDSSCDSNRDEIRTRGIDCFGRADRPRDRHELPGGKVEAPPVARLWASADAIRSARSRQGANVAQVKRAEAVTAVNSHPVEGARARRYVE